MVKMKTVKIQKILKQCNIVNNDYQQSSNVLQTFAFDKLFGQFLDISPKTFTFFKTFNSVFSYIELWFSDQNSKTLEIEDKIDITLVNVKYKKGEDIQFNLEIKYLLKAMDFCLWLKIQVKVLAKIEA